LLRFCQRIAAHGERAHSRLALWRCSTPSVPAAQHTFIACCRGAGGFFLYARWQFRADSFDVTLYSLLLLRAPPLRFFRLAGCLRDGTAAIIRGGISYFCAQRIGLTLAASFGTC